MFVKTYLTETGQNRAWLGPAETCAPSSPLFANASSMVLCCSSLRILSKFQSGASSQYARSLVSLSFRADSSKLISSFSFGSYRTNAVSKFPVPCLPGDSNPFIFFAIKSYVALNLLLMKSCVVLHHAEFALVSSASYVASGLPDSHDRKYVRTSRYIPHRRTRHL